jgi:thioesterase III
MEKSITEIKVRGYHADFYGHVNNARYLELLEEARWNHFENKMDYAEFQKNGWAFVVVNANINYRKPAVPGDTLQIHTAYKSHGSRSMILHQTCYLNGTEAVAADADITFVVLDAKTGKVMTLEGKLLEMLLPTAS